MKTTTALISGLLFACGTSTATLEGILEGITATFHFPGTGSAFPNAADALTRESVRGAAQSRDCVSAVPQAPTQINSLRSYDMPPW